MISNLSSHKIFDMHAGIDQQNRTPLSKIVSSENKAIKCSDQIHFGHEKKEELINLQKRIQHLHLETVNSKDPGNSNMLLTAIKTVGYILLSPVFLLIRGFQSFMSLFKDKTAPNKEISYTTEQFKELLIKNPNHPDCICYKLKISYDKLISDETKRQENPDLKGQKGEFYTKLMDLIQLIKDSHEKHPTNKRLEKLYSNIPQIGTLGLLSIENEITNDVLLKVIEIFKQKSPLNLINNDDEWFNFFHFLKNNQTTSSKWPESLTSLFNKVETQEDKAKFKDLIQIYASTDSVIFGHTNADTLFYNSKELIEKIGEKKFIALVNWLMSKEEPYTILQHDITPLSKSFTNVLQGLKESSSEEIKQFERTFHQWSDNFVQEYNERKILANLFGIGGRSKIKNQSFELDGLRTEKGNDAYVGLSVPDTILPLLSPILGDLIKTSEHKENLIDLKKSLENTNTTDLQIQICSNKPDHLKEEHHAWSQVRYKNYLLIGNRGLGSGEFPGILIFKINPENFKPENSSRYNLSIEPRYSYFFGINSDYLKQEYFQGLNPEFIGHIKLSPQSMGNCPWMGVKMNILSTLFIKSAYEDLEKGIPFKNIRKNRAPLFKGLIRKMMLPLRLNLLQNYLKKHNSKLSTQEPDRELLNKIAQKVEKKKWVKITEMMESFKEM